MRLSYANLLNLFAIVAVTQPVGAQRVERNIAYRAHPGPEHYMDVYVTTTTGFTDRTDMVANLVAAFVRDPKAVTATP